MLLLRIFRRILCIIFILKATVGQKGEQQQLQHEFMPDSATQILRYLRQSFPYYAPKPLMRKQYGSQNPKHLSKHRQQPENSGNFLAATEIAMKILSSTFPPDEKTFDDVFIRERLTKQQQEQELLEQAPNEWRRRLNDISNKQANFRRSQSQQQQEIENFNAENSNWHENAKNFDLNGDFAPVDNDDSARATKRMPGKQSEALHEACLDDTHMDLEQILAADTMRSTMSSAATDVEKTFYVPIVAPNNVEVHGEMKKDIMKRNPLAIDDYNYVFAQPRYPTGFDSERSNSKPMHLRSRKRERITPQRTTFSPSISAGAMTNLGSFFGDFSKNVHFNERNNLNEAKTTFLQGDHPVSVLQKDVESEADEKAKIDKTAQFLQAIRSYRPSQRIRSLVSMTPHGYHGSNFLDPNYMWVGLG